MSEELDDEVLSINSIYGDSTLTASSDGPLIHILVLPTQKDISIRVNFAVDYPESPPSILGTHHVGDNVAKGTGSDLVDLVREVLAEVYIPGSPCIFDLIEEAGQRLQQLDLGSSEPEDERPHDAQRDGQLSTLNRISNEVPDVSQSMDNFGEPPPWTSSDVVTEKKSIFIARAVAVSSVGEAKQFLAHLLSTNKKVAKATHNITAWRVQGQNDVKYQDCDDDGETAAGSRLLHLLELMNAWNVMVVVTRWYGGVQLGPDRFRIINQTAREAVIKGELVEEVGGKDGSKKKGKR
ncbi:hypothetical protein LTR78_000278 [Recurvomyces mirabilis]|uniref:RWD domain-containing protein n=1 Tax=Recurvomyces mirabilis TaxID=574656 RepID=A0AAE0WWU1_9PEZI|nr:hypothetical protein LTR78_000278 [Recurvomyces mirabilis]KAK5161933.1 hypothetical protein LTS14_000279 [Recurvomyces mirabilis]